MTVQLLTNMLIGLAIVGFLVRRLRWRAFDPARALRLPIILAAIGALSFSRLGSQSGTTTDLAFLVLELAISVGIGAAMGRLTTFRTDPAEPHALLPTKDPQAPAGESGPGPVGRPFTAGGPVRHGYHPAAEQVASETRCSLRHPPVKVSVGAAGLLT